MKTTITIALDPWEYGALQVAVQRAEQEASELPGPATIEHAKRLRSLLDRYQGARRAVM